MFSPFADAQGVPQWEALLEQACIFQALTFNDRQVAEDIIGICGGGQIRQWEWSTGSWPPSLVMYRQANVITIHVTGTENLAQLWGDVIGVYARPYANLGCKVHTFFEDAWFSVRDRITPNLPDDWRTCSFRFFGHSLGAAVAFLGSLAWKRDNPNMRVDLLAMAMPKSLTIGYNGFLPNTCNFVASPEDLVPLVPPNGMIAALNVLTPAAVFSIPQTWVHYATGWFLDYNNRPLTQGTADDFNRTPSPAILGTTAVVHYGENYLGNILQGWGRYVGSGQDVALQPIAIRLSQNPPLQTLANNIDAPSLVDIPQQNRLAFDSPGPGPLTEANLRSVNSLTGRVSGVTRTNAIFPVLTPGDVMADSKMTIYMNDGNGSFSESFFRAGVAPGGVTPLSIMNFTDALVRVLGGQTTITKVRVSSVGVSRRTILYRLETLRAAVAGAVPAPFDLGWTGMASVGGHSTVKESDIAGTALLLEKRNDLRTANWFLRGIPDDIVQTGGVYRPFPNFVTQLRNLRNVVVTGWCWQGVSDTQPTAASITNAVTGLDGLCTFTLGANLFNGIPVNSTKVVRVSRQRSPGNINGNVTVVVKSDTTCITVRPLSVNNFVAGTGKMRFTNVTLVPITDLVAQRIVTRRAGRPTDQSVGRAKARARG